jgi:hypothetical protein
MKTDVNFRLPIINKSIFIQSPITNPLMGNFCPVVGPDFSIATRDQNQILESGLIASNRKHENAHPQVDPP